MKVKSFVISAIAALAALVSCEEPNTNLGAPKIALDTEEMTFDAAGGEKTLNVTATRDWMVDDYKADWVVVGPESGSAAADPQAVNITVLPNAGMDREVSIKFTIGMASRYLTVKQAGPGGSAEQLVIFHNDFDKEEATKTFGSGESWPYLDQFDGWKNQTGTGAANVEYAFKAMSARANSTSNSNYSDYEGSGSNNMFFGKDAYLATKNIALGGATNITMTFGTEKYSQTLGSVFTPSEFHIFLSQDGNKWVEFKDYTFAGGSTEGRWNLATANFSVPAGTANLSVCMQVDAASSYRMDDLKLVIASEAGTAVDFSNAKEMDFGAGGTGGGDNGGGNVTPPSNIKDVTVAQFNEAAVSTSDWYRLRGTVGGPINSTYGNFDLIDETGKVYVYGIDNWADYKAKVAEGGTIVVVGQRGDYNGKIEVLEGYIESYDGSTAGGGNEGGENPPAGDPGEYDPQGITWTLGANAYDNTSGQNAQTAIVNGVQVNNLLKLGTGSKVGDATLHIPSGTKKIGAYIVAWKGKTATLKASVGGVEVASINPAANASATGNPPYPEFTLADSDYYEIEVNVESAVDVKIETTDPANGRVLIFALKAIK